MRLKFPDRTKLGWLTRSCGFRQSCLFVLLFGSVWPAAADRSDDARPQSQADDLVVSIADASATEGRPVEFKVSVSMERSVPLEVDWEASSETAIAGVDFQPVQAGTLKIPPGATEGVIRIRTLEDRLAEPDDTFQVSLLDVTPIPPDGAFVSEESHTATGTILNDDGDLVIPDSNFEHVIRAELRKPSGEPVTREDLASLNSLYVYVSLVIEDLTGLQFATNLRHLDLILTDVVDLSPLAHLRSLTALTVWNGSLRDLSPLRTMVSLRELRLSDNDISDLDPLRGLTGLHTLTLDGNNITDIEPLAGLVNLSSLSLGINRINDLGPLDRLTYLYDIELIGNAVSDLSPLQSLTNLGRLNIADNRIRDIAPLAGMTELWWIDLGRNLISDIKPLVPDDKFAYRKAIYLHDNPLSDDSLRVHVPAVREAGADVHTVSVNLADASAREGQPLTFWVYLSAPVDEPVDLLWHVDNLTYSTRDADYEAPSSEISELTIPAGDTEISFAVPTIRDQVEEPHEPLVVQLYEPPQVASYADHPGFPTGVTMSLPENRLKAVGLILEAGAPVREIPFVTSADRATHQSVVRIINHQRRNPTAVHIESFDDAGDGREPVTLRVFGGHGKQFTSQDLETGSLVKGLSRGVGSSRGDWRLRVQSNDVDAYAYVRSGDGLLTNMNDLIPLTSAGYFVPRFNPGRNPNQVSWLRLTNNGDRSASVRITGIDDAGRSPGSNVRLRVAPGQSRLFSASMLESGTGSGLEGALGRGTGKWRLIVASNVRIRVMNLLESPTGHLSNLSTLAKRVESEDGDETSHLVPLFPSAMDRAGRQGFIRVVNRTDESATVRINARDDTRWSYDPVTLTVDAGAAVQLNSHDLESGNPDKGLPRGTGAGEGDWRLELTSEQDIAGGSYFRTEAGC